MKCNIPQIPYKDIENYLNNVSKKICYPTHTSIAILRQNKKQNYLRLVMKVNKKSSAVVPKNSDLGLSGYKCIKVLKQIKMTGETLEDAKTVYNAYRKCVINLETNICE